MKKFLFIAIIGSALFATTAEANVKNDPVIDDSTALVMHPITATIDNDFAFKIQSVGDIPVFIDVTVPRFDFVPVDKFVDNSVILDTRQVPRIRDDIA